MAHLQYYGIDLQIERTAEVSIEPVQDPLSGLDRLYQKVRLSMICVWNPAATNAATCVSPPLASNPANRLGVSINNLQQMLMTPQKLLVFSIGPDRVFQVPATFLVNGNPVQAPCDPAGGPFPKSCRILAIHGDKTALVQYTIEFHVTDCVKVVLSNRWSVTSQTGPQWLTTRVTEGRAVLSLDQLALNNTVADAFRGNFSLYVPPGFIRTDVNVVATEDGREVMYRVVDRQANISLDPKWAIVKVEGNCTAGSDFPYPKLTDLATGMGHALADDGGGGGGFWHRLGAWGKGLFVSANSGMSSVISSGGLGLGAALAGQAAGLVPRQKGNAIVRVFGGANVAYDNLAQIAVNIAYNCFAPAFNANGPNGAPLAYEMSSYVTQVFDTQAPGPVVQARLEVALLSINALTAMRNARLLPMSFGYVLQRRDGGETYSNASGANPSFPNGSTLVAPANNASRGTWTAFLVTQALTQGCQINAVPASDNAFPSQPGTAQLTVAGQPQGFNLS